MFQIICRENVYSLSQKDDLNIVETSDVSCFIMYFYCFKSSVQITERTNNHWQTPDTADSLLFNTKQATDPTLWATHSLEQDASHGSQHKMIVTGQYHFSGWQTHYIWPVTRVTKIPWLTWCGNTFWVNVCITMKNHDFSWETTHYFNGHGFNSVFYVYRINHNFSWERSIIKIMGKSPMKSWWNLVCGHDMTWSQEGHHLWGLVESNE